MFMKYFFLIAINIVNANAEKCVPGPFHKKYSSPATEERAACGAYNTDTCCTANFTNELNKTRGRVLLGFDWGHCKSISRKCDEFLLRAVCFFNCEPRLIRWHAGNLTLRNVPVCGDYCDDWYEACKDDQTCVQEWLTDFEFANSTYTCPRNSTCRKFSEWYGNGQRLCNKLFGQNFRYVDPKCPCTKMDGPIPNHINETSTCNTATSTTVSSPTKPSSYCPRGKYSFHATYLSLVLIAMIKY
ncbi:riboflavin-binding protein-like [Xenia sp. Carnegie-2017]|uniref:riboflavin-binding protein-like n=1 Tax=Xenia sp. Carnegie-2017 TaxID=2897299 RepID=UPI001F0332A4|nr:riboflavin-binding protein-like [Xenia sp. Carnegie-2017]